MKKIIEVLAWILVFVLMFMSIWKLQTYRENQREAERIEAMCNLSDARLVRSGMIDCRGVRDWKKN